MKMPARYPLDLTGKNVLVTGASSGIGRATAILASQLGAKVGLVARREQALQTTLESMDGEGHALFPFDVTKATEVDSWMCSVASQMGPLDVLVHCAGRTHTEALRYYDEAVLDGLVDLNLKSAFGFAKAFRHKKVRRASSQISMVFVSSISGIRGYPGMSMYSATKAALLGLTSTLAAELARDSVRVNSVVPGLVTTEMTQDFSKHIGEGSFEAAASAYPLGIGSPEDVANAIVFLASDAAKWITGVSLVVDGGATIG